MESDRCLLDTGNGGTYLASDMLQSLGSLESIGLNRRLRLFTLLGECDRRFSGAVLEIDLGSGHAHHSPVLVADTLKLFVYSTN